MAMMEYMDKHKGFYDEYEFNLFNTGRLVDED